ncbi:MCP four helix bundle domain-containing protein [Clostridium autoethanogenum]|uniref:MCP four helix bundle domain-containing protein n=1 Tax=Clostridium autoethanogenum TaxID=84023 RepID=UPI0003BAD496|nr:TPA_exp: 4HB MCP domain containing protein [Clostridium autoethanogenum DSM 10061]
MNFLKNIHVKTKFLTSFAIMALLIALVGVIGIASLKKVSVNSEKMYSTNLQNVYTLTDINGNLANIRAEMFKVVYYQRSDVETRQSTENDIQKNRKNIAKILKLMRNKMAILLQKQNKNGICLKVKMTSIWV